MVQGTDGNNPASKAYFYASYDDVHDENAGTSSIDKKDTKASSVFTTAQIRLEVEVKNKCTTKPLSEKLSEFSDLIKREVNNALNQLNIQYTTTETEANSADTAFLKQSDNDIGNIRKTINNAISAAENAAKQDKPQEDADKPQITYAKNGESFKATAKRLGFNEGTDEYEKFKEANQKAAGRSHGGWFKVGEKVIIPPELKDMVVNGEILSEEQGQKEVDKYTKAIKAKQTQSKPAQQESVAEPKGIEADKNGNTVITLSNGNREIIFNNGNETYASREDTIDMYGKTKLSVYRNKKGEVTCEKQYTHNSDGSCIAHSQYQNGAYGNRDVIEVFNSDGSKITDASQAAQVVGLYQEKNGDYTNGPGIYKWDSKKYEFIRHGNK